MIDRNLNLFTLLLNMLKDFFLYCYWFNCETKIFLFLFQNYFRVHKSFKNNNGELGKIWLFTTNRCQQAVWQQKNWDIDKERYGLKKLWKKNWVPLKKLRELSFVRLYWKYLMRLYFWEFSFKVKRFYHNSKRG